MSYVLTFDVSHTFYAFRFCLGRDPSFMFVVVFMQNSQVIFPLDFEPFTLSLKGISDNVIPYLLPLASLGME